MYEKETILDLKKLFVPDHLLCVISGEILLDPVTITSGRTFDRGSILEYFRLQKEKIA